MCAYALTNILSKCLTAYLKVVVSSYLTCVSIFGYTMTDEASFSVITQSSQYFIIKYSCHRKNLVLSQTKGISYIGSEPSKPNFGNGSGH